MGTKGSGHLDVQFAILSKNLILKNDLNLCMYVNLSIQDQRTCLHIPKLSSCINTVIGNDFKSCKSSSRTKVEG